MEENKDHELFDGCSMLLVTKLNGDLLYINPQLLKFIESQGDCIVTLTTGERIRIQESAEQLSKSFTQSMAELSQATLAHSDSLA